MEFELRPFDPFKATRKEWDLYHQYRRKRSDEVYPGDPITADDVVEHRLRFWTEEEYFETHTIYSKEDPEMQIGLLRMAMVKESSASYEENKHSCDAYNLELLAPYRGKGIGTKLLHTALDFAKRFEKTLIVGWTTEDQGKRFIKKLKAEEALTGVQNRLDMTKLDWNMIDEWAKEGPVRSPDSTLEFFEDVPDSFLEEYCHIYTEVMNQAPREQLNVGDWIITPELRRKYEAHSKDIGDTWLTAITREPNGDVSGLTEIIYRPSSVPLIFQDLTGVREKYRGSGKGKWLKAVMLQEIKKRYPTVTTVVTGNATSNAPMLSINERLGFKVHKASVVAQIKTEALEKYLKDLE